ncbi:VLRF1 family aeRF1-type release factor [Evansella clarkii]|uniref:VLRF1 family aeRF1-type release factor n=1 Tax=Evansella clarkii TaxID=79879 RepID=UPI000998DB8E|nr:VLRF1 family aeRF1-type release factor [Evansella clarkii]
MALADELKALREFRCEEGKCVLSVYLNTDRADSEQQKGEWKIRLKNGLKRHEEYLEASENKDQLKSFRKLRKKVENEVNGNQSQLQKSVVIFASDVDDLWSVHYMQLPVETSFHWEEAPVLDQLTKLQQDFPKSGIVLPNMDEVKILETDLGEIQDTRIYSFDPDTGNWNYKQGMGAEDKIMSGATHTDKYDQRFQENLNRFYKDMAGNIERLKQDRNWEALYLVGEADPVNTLESQLRVPVDKSVKKNLNNVDTSKVLEQVFN